MIKLFDISNNKVVPSEHCFLLPFLKNVMTEFPDNYLVIYSYIFYMSCKSSENPYYNRPKEELQEEILRDLGVPIDTENLIIRIAMERCKELYETPTVRAYNGISNMLDKLAFYMETQSITDGRDGNINSIIGAAKNFDAIRKSFKGVAKDLEEEQSSRARGGQKLSYDD